MTPATFFPGEALDALMTCERAFNRYNRYKRYNIEEAIYEEKELEKEAVWCEGVRFTVSV